jgi:MFS family permease
MTDPSYDIDPVAIPRPVRLLGWASLFTDAATEMIYPLLPVYLSRVLGASAVSLGIIEGVAEAINSLLKVVAGYWSDRVPRRKPIVIAGYGLSSLARPFIAVTSTWPQVLAIRALDRTGKGIRGAPRDAMLATFAARESRGRIFGFHRAMDHAGAIVGPLVATAILFVAPEQYRLVFALTVIPGAIAVALLFRVPEERQESRGANLSESRGANPSGLPGKRGALALHDSTPFWSFLAVLLIFSLGNSADAFLLLRLSDALGSATFVPLIWSALHVVKSSLSTWGGGLSDRVGRKRVIVIGWTIYAVVYVGFAASTTATTLIAWFLAYGVFFALTEGAEKALVADLTPAHRQGTAFGFYNAALGVGALGASVMFGFLYDRFGAPAAFGTGAALAGVAALLLALVPTRTPAPPHPRTSHSSHAAPSVRTPSPRT